MSHTNYSYECMSGGVNIVVQFNLHTIKNGNIKSQHSRKWGLWHWMEFKVAPPLPYLTALKLFHTTMQKLSAKMQNICIENYKHSTFGHTGLDDFLDFYVAFHTKIEKMHLDWMKGTESTGSVSNDNVPLWAEKIPWILWHAECQCRQCALCAYFIFCI